MGGGEQAEERREKGEGKKRKEEKRKRFPTFETVRFQKQIESIIAAARIVVL